MFSVNYRQIKNRELSCGSKIITKSFRGQITNLKKDSKLKDKIKHLKKKTEIYCKSLQKPPKVKENKLLV